jgi:hypothetical protein
MKNILFLLFILNLIFSNSADSTKINLDLLWPNILSELSHPIYFNEDIAVRPKIIFKKEIEMPTTFLTNYVFEILVTIKVDTIGNSHYAGSKVLVKDLTLYANTTLDLKEYKDILNIYLSSIQKAIKEWRYVPAINSKGKKVNSHINYLIRFGKDHYKERIYDFIYVE